MMGNAVASLRRGVLWLGNKNRGGRPVAFMTLAYIH